MINTIFLLVLSLSGSFAAQKKDFGYFVFKISSKDERAEISSFSIYTSEIAKSDFRARRAKKNDEEMVNFFIINKGNEVIEKIPFLLKSHGLRIVDSSSKELVSDSERRTSIEVSKLRSVSTIEIKNESGSVYLKDKFSNILVLQLAKMIKLVNGDSAESIDSKIREVKSGGVSVKAIGRFFAEKYLDCSKFKSSELDLCKNLIQINDLLQGLEE